MIRPSLLPLSLVALLALVFNASPVQAESVVYAGSKVVGTGVSQRTLAAQVEFKMVGNNLQITLTNTSAKDVTAPGDLLTAVFFDITTLPTISASKYISAIASSVVQEVDVKTKVGKTTVTTATEVVTNNKSVISTAYAKTGGWAFASKTSNALVSTGQHYAFGTAGMGVFSTLAGGQQFGYGLVNSGFDTRSDGNSGMKGSEFIRSSVTFTLQNLGRNFDPSTLIKSVRFQYGTDLTSGYPTFNGTKVVNTVASTTPEPSSLALMGFGVVGLIGMARRRKIAISG